MRFVFALLLTLVSTSVYALGLAGHPVPTAPHLDANGWTVFTASTGAGTCGAGGTYTGTCIYYVSNAGSDTTNNCTNINSPCKTIAYAKTQLRGNYPDWLLLKCGDTFTNDNLGVARYNNGNSLTGRSASEPLVIAGYTTTTPATPDPYDCPQRPVVATTSVGVSWVSSNGANSPQQIALSYLVIAGIQFECAICDPNNGSFNPTTVAGASDWAAIFPISPTTWLWIEDCLFNYANLTIETQYPAPPDGFVMLRRNAFYRSWGGTGSLGLFGNWWSGATVEENVFDHAGYEGIYGWTAYSLLHNVYLHNPPILPGYPIVFQKNISARSPLDVQDRPGGTVYNNLFVQNPSAIYCTFTPCTVTYNVVTESIDPWALDPVAATSGTAIGGTVINVPAFQTTNQAGLTSYYLRDLTNPAALTTSAKIASTTSTTVTISGTTVQSPGISAGDLIAFATPFQSAGIQIDACGSPTTAQYNVVANPTVTEAALYSIQLGGVIVGVDHPYPCGGNVVNSTVTNNAIYGFPAIEDRSVSSITSITNNGGTCQINYPANVSYWYPGQQAQVSGTGGVADGTWTVTPIWTGNTPFNATSLLLNGCTYTASATGTIKHLPLNTTSPQLSGFSDPTRTLARYDNEVLGNPGACSTSDGWCLRNNFLALAVANTKHTWNTVYTANDVNNWIRAGFGIVAQ